VNSAAPHRAVSRDHPPWHASPRLFGRASEVATVTVKIAEGHLQGDAGNGEWGGEIHSGTRVASRRCR